MEQRAAILVQLPEQTIGSLFGLRECPEETLAQVVDRLVNARVNYASSLSRVRSAPSVASRYQLRVMGEEHAFDSLPEALAFALNIVADIDESVLDRLAKTGGRTRRNVARSRDAIHPGRPDLNLSYTHEFRRGWWIGKNYSFRDVRRILRDLCSAAGLAFGHDLEFEKEQM